MRFRPKSNNYLEVEKYCTITVGDLEYPDPKSVTKYAESKTNAQQSAMEFEMLAKEVLEEIGVS